MKQAVNREYLKELLRKIKETTPDDMTINIMEVCGTHTMEIGRSGLRQLIPDNIKLISGPGCPVCVTHDAEIETYLELTGKENVITATFGDLMRVPGKNGSLADARGRGAEVKLVYSTLDALEVARRHPEKEVVFLGAGFETTAPTVGASIIQAAEENIENYSVFSMHKLVPPALRALLQDDELNIDGFLLPGHVSAVIGIEPYQFAAEKHKKAGVIAGFETGDILESIYMLLNQIVRQAPKVELQYKRAVKNEGNPKAREIMYTVFKPGDALWRGFGWIPESGLLLKEEYEAFDAKVKFAVQELSAEEETIHVNCACGDVLKGIKTPMECKLFDNGCTPLNPIGPCMVSSEGACAAYYKYSLN